MAVDRGSDQKKTPTRITIRPASTEGPWRALWERLLAPESHEDVSAGPDSAGGKISDTSDTNEGSGGVSE